jgi:hypothetical protein
MPQFSHFLPCPSFTATYRQPRFALFSCPLLVRKRRSRCGDTGLSIMAHDAFPILIRFDSDSDPLELNLYIILLLLLLLSSGSSNQSVSLG